MHTITLYVVPSRIPCHERPLERNYSDYRDLYLLSGGAPICRQSPRTFSRPIGCLEGLNERSASRKDAIRFRASYVGSSASSFFGARAGISAAATAPSPWPAPHTAHELCEATPLEGCRRRLSRRCPIDRDADRLAVIARPRHHRKCHGNAALCSRR
jgi:hypothetical protein